MYAEQILLNLQENKIEKQKNEWLKRRKEILIGYEHKKSLFAKTIKDVLKTLKIKKFKK